jgi:hypothetical protein
MQAIAAFETVVTYVQVTGVRQAAFEMILFENGGTAAKKKTPQNRKQTFQHETECCRVLILDKNRIMRTISTVSYPINGNWISHSHK